MRKYFLILSFFLAYTLTGRCQQYFETLNKDSLKGLLNPGQNREKSKLLFSQSKAYWHKNWDSALFFAFQALQLSHNISDTRGMAEAYRYIGVGNMFRAKGNIAGPYLDTALKLFKNLHDTVGLAATYNNIGVLLSHDLSKYRESNFAFEQAIILFQKLSNNEGLGSALNYLGLNYQAQGNFQKAIEYLLKGLEVRKKIGDKPGMMFSMARVGDIYKALRQSDTALKYYNGALQFANENTASANADVNGQIASLYMQLERYEKARKYIDVALKNDSEWFRLLLARYYFETGLTEKALDIYEQIMVREQTSSDYALLASTLMGMCRVYELKKNYGAATKYATSAFGVANDHTIRWIISDAANMLSSLHAKQGDYQKAYNYEKIYRSIADSLSSADSYIKLGFLESKNEILKKQSSIELLNKENQIKEQQLKRETLLKKIFIAGIAFVLLITVVLFRNSSLKRKNEKHRRELAENELQIQKLASERTKASFQQQATELEMQALRAQMNPHFIFNCLSSINRFILINKTEEASDYLTKFSRLIRMALHNSEKSFITLESELEALRLYLDLERLRFKNAFDYSITYINTIDLSAVFIPPLLIQPFAENAIWHGLMHKEGTGNLDIALNIDDKILNCIISDNGIGRTQASILKSKSAEKNKSMGMQITVERLAKLNEGSDQNSFFGIEDLTDENGRTSGTKVVLKIKYRDLSEAVDAHF